MCSCPESARGPSGSRCLPARGKRARGFTLIEVLAAVAIIAILAAIAIPNLLDAQMRAKVSRASNDLRVIAMALEAYRLDAGDYPPHRGPGAEGHGEKEDVHVLNGHGEPRNFGFRTIPLRLSTPVAYITASALPDPFKTGAVDTSGLPYVSGDPTDLAYVYHNIYQYAILQMSPDFFPDDFTEDYGHWRLASLGPGGLYGGFGTSDRGWLYDPTNGLRSRGMIVRTQLDISGGRLQRPDEE
ncbi:MAG: prepilin-type N-terminal cleavage/methylation domain-containing protein [Candidatus Sumerlaeia bacterium]|nr:prepilin-type N-terminal cleavage/methylation domain-containing protein [Candidatus Sumerlaeia bacterium]